MSKEICRAERKYMNMPPPPNQRFSYGPGEETGIPGENMQLLADRLLALMSHVMFKVH